RVRWLLLCRLADDLRLDGFALPGPTASRQVLLDALQAVLGESIPPTSNGMRLDAQLRSDVGVGRATRRQQHHPSAVRLPLRQRSAPGPRLKRPGLGLAQRDLDGATHGLNLRSYLRRSRARGQNYMPIIFASDH